MTPKRHSEIIRQDQARIKILEKALEEAEAALSIASRILSGDPNMRVGTPKEKKWGQPVLDTIRAALKGERG